MLKKALWSLTFLPLIAFAACEEAPEDDTFVGPGSTTSGMDSTFMPEPNGVHIGETEACTILQTAVQEKALDLNCSKTVRTCPGFLRVQYDPDCVQYDEGTVTACKDYYESSLSCDDLVEEDCVLVVYPGTEPAGCP